MPRFAEFKLDNLLEEVKDDVTIMNHLPDLTTPKARHNKKFVATVIATIKPNWIWNLLETAHTQRLQEQPIIPDTEPLAVTEEFR